MTYATQQDLVDRFGALELVQLTDRTNTPPTTIDTTVVGKALADADGLVNGYVGKVYDLPLATVPNVLVKMAADIARYFLHGEAAEKDSVVTRNYSAAVAWLKDVAKGLVTFGEADQPAQPGGGSVRTNEPERLLTAQTLKGYI